MEDTKVQSTGMMSFNYLKCSEEEYDKSNMPPFVDVLQWTRLSCLK